MFRVKKLIIFSICMMKHFSWPIHLFLFSKTFERYNLSILKYSCREFSTRIFNNLILNNRSIISVDIYPIKTKTETQWRRTRHFSLRVLYTIKKI